MKQLTFSFPENATARQGAPFWSAPKRFPKPLDFSSQDPSHTSLILAASILKANTYGIPIPEWASDPNSRKLAQVVDKVHIPVFKPKEGVKIVTDEKATDVNPSSTLYDVDEAELIDKLITTLQHGVQNLPSDFRMNPIKFEKVSSNFAH